MHQTQYQISLDDKIIYMQLTGEPTADDFIKFLTRVSLDENYNCTFNSLIDLQHCNSMFSVSEAQEIIELAATIRKNNPVKSAIITDGFFKKNLVDMAGWVNRNKSLQVKGFTCTQRAKHWLQENAI